jgi:hypothetical protein
VLIFHIDADKKRAFDGPVGFQTGNNKKVKVSAAGINLGINFSSSPFLPTCFSYPLLPQFRTSKSAQLA